MSRQDVALYERTLQSALERLHDTVNSTARNAAMLRAKADVLDEAGAAEQADVLHRIEDRLQALEHHAEALYAQVRSVQAGNPEVLDYDVLVTWTTSEEGRTNEPRRHVPQGQHERAGPDACTR